MAEPDIAIIETDELLVRLERDIHATYAQAQEEMDKKLAKFMADFERKNKSKLALVSSGKMSQEDYDKWLKGQAFQKQWYQAMVQTLSDDMVKTDQKAMSIVRGFTPEAYAINHNFAAYECESGAGLDANFTLYNRQTVERIMKDYPELLPTPKPDVVSDLAWHNKKVGNAVMQGVLQGEGIPQIAKRLADVTGMDNRAAVRNARTAMTGAQNAGRIDTYKQAQDIGIELQMEWNASLDSRTRDSHRVLDGERRDIDKPFSNRCRYPADPQGPSHEIYNCRCYLRAVVKGSDQSARQRLGRIPEGITYEEWKAGKKFAEPEGKRSETYRVIDVAAPKEEKERATIAESGAMKGVKLLDQNQTVQSVVKEVNKNYGTSREYNDNCANCVVAAEARYRGYDVIARERDYSRDNPIPRFWYDNKYGRGSWTDSFNGVVGESVGATRKAKAAQAIEQKMKEYGDGSRAVIFVQWDGRSWGHYFNVANEGGSVVFYDAQNGAMGDTVRDYLLRARPSETRIWRVDDKEMTDYIRKVVKEND